MKKITLLGFALILALAAAGQDEAPLDKNAQLRPPLAYASGDSQLWPGVLPTAVATNLAEAAQILAPSGTRPPQAGTPLTNLPATGPGGSQGRANPSQELPPVATSAVDAATNSPATNRPSSGFAAAGKASAQGVPPTNVLTRVWGHLKAPWLATNSGQLFAAHELTLDVASSYSAPEPGGLGQLFSHNLRHGQFGLTLASTYWGTKNFGAGIEAAVRDFNHPTSLVIDSTTITVAGRYPLGPVAPYLLAGVGRNFADGLYNTQAGLGVEWRFTPRVAAFSDARFVWAYKQSAESLLVRTGLRFVF